jgi:hypothetical protein
MDREMETQYLTSILSNHFTPKNENDRTYVSKRLIPVRNLNI